MYKASITAPNIPTRHYFGLCETEFKARFYNHRSSFKDQRKMNATELSKAVWDYRNRGIEPLISWSIICKAAAFKSGAKRCNLCLAEKLAILQADQRTLLNKQSEFISKCRHRTKFKLKTLINTNLLFVVFHLCTVFTFILFLFYFMLFFNSCHRFVNL